MIDKSVIAAFDTISLEDMGKVRLMNRIDTKFVTDIDTVNLLLELAANHYLVQEIEKRTVMPYYTKYFDTADVDMFYQHQRGKKNRQKIRIRHYEESPTPPFVEVKSKNNKGRSSKKRTPMLSGENLTSYADFLERYTHYDIGGLVPQIENHFYRVTLVDHDRTERVTIDTGLEFHNLTNDARLLCPNLGIIEWKRDGRSRNSHLAALLNRMRVRPSGFSKYCIGMAVTNPLLKQNRLKKKLKYLSPYIT